MRLRKHTQNRDDRLRFVRMLTVWLYPDEDRDSLAQLSIEAVVLRKPMAEFSARFHLGKKWSETPLDAHLTIAGTGIYVSAGAKWLGTVAHALTKGEGRDLRLALYGRRLWWDLWVTEDHCQGRAHQHRYGRDKAAGKPGRYMPWRCRKGNIPSDPLETILGPKQYHYETIDTADDLVVMPEGTYPVSLKLQRVTRGYRDGKRRRYQHLSVGWNARPGIPWRYDRSGGWKGTEVCGSAIRVPEGIEDKNWAAVAVTALAAEATASRVRTGWTPEHQASTQ